MQAVIENQTSYSYRIVRMLRVRPNANRLPAISQPGVPDDNPIVHGMRRVITLSVQGQSHARFHPMRTMPKQEKPEWLKQWTISKGWMHNRSHLLHLPQKITGNTGEENFYDSDTLDSQTVESINPVVADPSEEKDLKVLGDYRRNFPKNEDLFVDLFAERLGFRYEENLLYDVSQPERNVKETKCDLTRIVECSEDSDAISLYENPLYETNRSLPSWQGSYEQIDGYEQVCLDDNVGFCRSSIDEIQKTRIFDFDRFDSLRDKLRLEKRVIRHIRVRIMLSLRCDAIKLKMAQRPSRKRKRRRRRRWKCFRSKQAVQHCDAARCYCDGRSDRRVRWMHEEQRRIGNGIDALKIQNMR